MKRLGWLVTTLVLAGGAAGAQNVGQGVALYNEGRYAEAEPVLRAAAENTEARALLAATLVRLERRPEAEAEARAVLVVDPVNATAVAALGQSLVMQEKLDEAIVAMSAALEAKNDQASAYYWRGQAHHRGKQIARMVDDYQAFLTLQPEAPEAPALRVLLTSLR